MSGSDPNLYPDWSPDGTRIAFFSGEPPTFDIYVYYVETGRLERVTDFGASGPGWLPDGRLFYVRDGKPHGRIVLHDLQTGHRKVVGNLK